METIWTLQSDIQRLSKSGPLGLIFSTQLPHVTGKGIFIFYTPCAWSKPTIQPLKKPTVVPDIFYSMMLWSMPCPLHEISTLTSQPNLLCSSPAFKSFNTSSVAPTQHSQSIFSAPSALIFPEEKLYWVLCQIHNSNYRYKIISLNIGTLILSSQQLVVNKSLLNVWKKWP